MALDGPSYYSNSIQGIPGAGVDINLYDVHSAPKYALGFLVERADGNRYRYCNVGTATNSGKLVGQTTASGGATYGAAVVVAPASAVAVQAEYPILPGQVGSHYVEVTIAGIAANKYEGGYLVTTRGTGLGETYRIAGNTATDTPATGNLRIQLNDAIKVALTVSTGIIIVPSVFTDLAATATTSATATGVLMSTTTSTNIYGWVCTRGVIGCAEDATNAVTAGQQLVASRVTAGSYATASSSASTILSGALQSPIIGYSITPAASSSRLGTIYLQLE
jgi:hypothetical protein